MANPATLHFEDKDYTLPTIIGTEGEKGIDISRLRAESGAVTYDDGLGNTGSCTSHITFIDGEKGILRYRGYPIDQLAENSNFVETAYLVINGELPTVAQRAGFSQLLTTHAPLREGIVFSAGPAPTPVRSGATQRLAYELHLTNHADAPLVLERIEVLDAASTVPLAALAAKIERVCQQVGLDPERRAFHPHITLARWKGRRTREVQAWLERTRVLSSEPFTVDAFTLFESRLSKHGAHYEEIAIIRSADWMEPTSQSLP